MESEREMLSRVESMASGSQTWDLSKNDIEALKYVLKSRAEMEAYIKRIDHPADEKGSPY